MRIECPNCNRLHMEDLGENLTIEASTDFMYSTRPQPQFFVEVKCSRCYKFNTIYND